MAIPLGDQKSIELIMKGNVAAPGASAKNIQAVFTFRRTTFVGAMVKVAISDAFQAAIGDDILDAVNEDYTQSSNDIRILNDSTDRHGSNVQSGVGAVVGDRLPTFCTVRFELQTSVRGRWAIGAKGLAPVTEDDTLNDILTGAAITRWQVVRDSILAGFTDANGNVWIPTVTSRKYSQLRVNPTTILEADVTAVLLNLTIGRMSRRKQKTVR